MWHLKFQSIADEKLASLVALSDKTKKWLYYNFFYYWQLKKSGEQGDKNIEKVAEAKRQSEIYGESGEIVRQRKRNKRASEWGLMVDIFRISSVERVSCLTAHFSSLVNIIIGDIIDMLYCSYRIVVVVIKQHYKIHIVQNYQLWGNFIIF